MLVAGDAGKGRALALLTDTAWHWGFLAAGEGDDGRAFQRFWENAIRWLVRDPGADAAAPGAGPARVPPQPADRRARARDARRLLARRRGVEVTLAVVGRRRRRPAREPLRSLHATTDADGEAHVDVGALPPGAYRLTGRATVDGAPGQRTRRPSWSAPAAPSWTTSRRATRCCARSRRRQAAATRSRSWTTSPIRSSREVRVGRQQSVEIWSAPPLLLLGVALLALEWALRRRMGHS